MFCFSPLSLTGVESAYLDQINLSERLIVPGLLDIQNADDVLVVEVSQQFHLAQGPQTEHAVVERRDLLNGNLLTRRLVECRAGERKKEKKVGGKGLVFENGV